MTVKQQSMGVFLAIVGALQVSITGGLFPTRQHRILKRIVRHVRISIAPLTRPRNRTLTQPLTFLLDSILKAALFPSQTMILLQTTSKSS